MPRAAMLLFVALGIAVPVAFAQSADVSSTFRVFLSDGRALPAYGEAAVVDDRVVFNLAIGAGASVKMQLMSLPKATVDLDRTERYARAVRAAYYGATAGETEYRDLITRVAKTLDSLPDIQDPKERLKMAEDALHSLIQWSRDHYDYRASDIRTLAEQFEPVIADLRARAGESQFSFALVAGPSINAEPLRAAPGLRESVDLAMTAADAADDPADREAVLRASLEALADAAGVDDLRTEIAGRLDSEVKADKAYAALSAELLARADAALRVADVKTAESLLAELDRRDQALGRRRPAARRTLSDAIAAKLELTRVFRRSLDRYAEIRPQLLAYERDVRPVVIAIDGLRPVLDAIQRSAPAGFATTTMAITRLEALPAKLSSVTPPEDVAPVQAAFESAVHLAAEACARHKQVLIAPNSAAAREASAAAAGALLLFDQARKDLLTRLFPPKAQ